jgi:hypothetical protein
MKITIKTGTMQGTTDRMLRINDEAAMRLAKKAKREWESLARKNLRSTRRSYLEAIQEPEHIGKGVYRITFEGTSKYGEHEKYLPYMTEMGFPHVPSGERINQLLGTRPDRVIPIGARTLDRKTLKEGGKGVFRTVARDQAGQVAPERRNTKGRLTRQRTIKDDDGRRARQMWELPARPGKKLHKQVIKFIRENAAFVFTATWDES